MMFMAISLLLFFNPSISSKILLILAYFFVIFDLYRYSLLFRDYIYRTPETNVYCSSLSIDL